MNQTESINITTTNATDHQSYENTVARPALSTSDIISLVVGVISITIALVTIAQVFYNRRIQQLSRLQQGRGQGSPLDSVSIDQLQTPPSQQPSPTPPPSAHTHE